MKSRDFFPCILQILKTSKLYDISEIVIRYNIYKNPFRQMSLLGFEFQKNICNQFKEWLGTQVKSSIQNSKRKFQ